MEPVLGNRRQSARLYRFVARFYDTLRPLFAGFHSTREAYYQYLEVGSEDRILDLGCGTGESTRELPGEVSRRHGVDLSSSQVGIAARKRDVADANFVIGDAMSLPYRAAVFDAVVSVGAVQHVPDVGDVLAEAHRVTVPDGHLFLVGPKRPESVLGGAVADALMHFMRPAEMERLAVAAGWSDVGIDLVHMDYLARDAMVLTGTA